MTIATRAVLKAYFNTGDTISESNVADLIDSFVALADTTAQSLSSDLTVVNLIAAGVSAGTGNFTTSVSAAALHVAGASNLANVSAQRVTASAATILAAVSADSVYASAGHYTFVSAANLKFGEMKVDVTARCSTTGVIPVPASCAAFILVQVSGVQYGIPLHKL